MDNWLALYVAIVTNLSIDKSLKRMGIKFINLKELKVVHKEKTSEPKEAPKKEKRKQFKITHKKEKRKELKETPKKNITRNQLINKVIEIVYREGCSYVEAVRQAPQELGMSVVEFLEI